MLTGARPAIAQVTGQTPPPLPPPPTDPAEAGQTANVPLRIGSATLTGSIQADAIQTAGDDLDETTDMFRIRRARIGLAGNLTPRIGWNISGELTAQPALRNAFLVFRLWDQMNVRVGQANPFTALERGTSVLTLELIDRSLVTNRLTGPLDAGLSVFNAQPFKQWLSYAVNVNNGSGFNVPDDNDAKDVSGRIAVTPPRVPGLTIAASGTRGEEATGLRTRSSLGVDYNGTSVRVMVEGLRQAQAGLSAAKGVLATALYRYHPAVVTPHFKMLELVARYSVLNDPAANAGPDVISDDGNGSATDSSVSTTRELQVGGNYYVTGSMRIMGQVVVPMDAREHVGTTMLARLQVTF